MSRGLLFAWLCWSLWTDRAAAQFQSITPAEHREITFTIHVSDDAAKSKSGSIYFQMNSTRPIQWFSLAQGIHMRDSNMFIVYTSSRHDNITVSPRLGKGHFLPLYNPHADVSILDGSGVHNGSITANIRCDSCITWEGGREDLESPASPWIWAIKYGKPLNSDSVTAHLLEHDDDGVAFVNMKKATGSLAIDATANPFSDLANANITPAWNRPPFDSVGLNKKKIAHAVLMTVVFTALFPFSAIILYLFPSSGIVTIHATLQLFNLIIAIAGFAVGISMSQQIHLMRHHHPIIGIIVVAGLTIFQPAMGLIQHRHYHKTGGKGAFAYLHRWFGRAMMILGVINVGLGFQLTGWRDPFAPRGAVITCSIMAGMVAAVYILIIGLTSARNRRAASG
ncbi:hypothetical protein N7532_009692 [Penicillium argentinense]|uniref:Cytochrome b561 domain-containing protein n=1 Tax=Penicillium argentinense TaxID=1131581 RepID=A0A9W9EZW5_9EURO|nr:uncharacterized protein N7532_009692 [Penicillium argentinense]KAJ5091008.1 hypothetical protein N7532_009692 [Penicillium argentinense]